MNPVNSVLQVDIGKPTPLVVHAKQGESLSRKLTMLLYRDGNRASIIPSEGTVEYWVRYDKPDGTYGLYSLLPDNETPAVEATPDVHGDQLAVTLAPQVLTCAGDVHLSVSIVAENVIFCTFAVLIVVEKAESITTTSDNWFNCPTLENIVRMIGNIALLNTTDKSSAVAAINELVGLVGTVSNLTTSAKSNLVAAINELVTTIGSLSSLTTVAQNNLVAAINEAASRGGAIKLSATRATGSTKDFQASDARLDAEPTEGQQVIICCNLTNDAAAPTLAINGGTAYPIKLRDATERNPGTETDTTTIGVPKKGLIKGMPYLMTFYQRDSYTDKCWLIDSQVGVIDAAEKSYVDQELLRLIMQLEGYTDRHIAVSKFGYDTEHALYSYIKEDYEANKLCVVTKDGSDYVLSDHNFSTEDALADRYALFTCNDPTTQKVKWVRVDGSDIWSCGDYDSGNVFSAVYGETTVGAISDAITAGKVVVASRNGLTYALSTKSANTAIFATPLPNEKKIAWIMANVADANTVWSYGSYNTEDVVKVHYSYNQLSNSTLQDIYNAIAAGKDVVCESNDGGDNPEFRYCLVEADFRQESAAHYALFCRIDIEDKLLRWVKASADPSSLSVTTWTRGYLSLDHLARIDPVATGKVYATLSGSTATNSKYVALIPDATGLTDVNDPDVAATDPRIKLHGGSRNVDLIALTAADGKNELRLFGDNQNNNVHLSGILDPRPNHPYDAINQQTLDAALFAIYDTFSTSVMLAVTYGESAYNDLDAAHNRGQVVFCAHDGRTYIGPVASQCSYALYSIQDNGQGEDTAIHYIRVWDDDSWEYGSVIVGNTRRSTARLLLAYNGWTESNGLYYQTVNATALYGIGADESVLLQACPAPASVAAWTAYGVQLISATAGTMTFKSDSQPAQGENINVIVAIWR